MNIFCVKMLLFNFLINILVLPHYEIYLNNHYNIRIIPNNTQRTTIKSRLLTEIQKSNNPHYHNDPELKEIIDKLNEEAIKKYQQSHDPYEQLQEVVEKNGTKTVGGHVTEPMSTIEKELFETYEKLFGDENRIMLKSDMYPNNDDRSDKSSTCECIDTNNATLTKTKGKDKYLKHLKDRCNRGICICSIGSVFLTLIGLVVAKKAALSAFALDMTKCASFLNITNMFNITTLGASIKTGGAALKAGSICVSGAADTAGTAVGYSTAAILPFSIAIYVLIAIIVLLIILYIWLYIRRKNSWKHECKKHLCK
ncbi:stevor [Plasmodium sp. gorilla clade G1]|nr:stevor [Plasmodium sp. gorilla clade G1]